MNTQSQNNSPTLKPKDEDLRKIVQGFKLVNLKCNHSEIALIAGITKGTAHNKNKMITDWWSTESNTPDDDKKFLTERSIEIGIKEVLAEKNSTLEHVFGVILGTYLKTETAILDEVETLKTAWTIGRHLTKIYRTMSRYKNKKSVSIHSENQSAKYLLNNKKMLDELFKRSDDYLSDKYSKRWTSTELLTKYVQASNNKLLDMIINYPNILHPVCPLYMSPSNDTKKYFLKLDHNNIYPNLLININILKKFEINSVFSLLVRMVKLSKDEIHIPVKHESAKTDEFCGRSYNIFCSLRSHERLQLGFISYDMSAALQSISLQLIKATKDDYPMLWRYANDKAYKKSIRLEIAQDLNHVDDNGSIDTSRAKAKLTAFAHGSTKGIKQHKHYESFQLESDRLRREVLKHVSENDSKVLERAIEQSSRELPDELDWLDIDNFETTKEMRDKASVFFFVWTWYERQIRQAMIDALGDNEASEALEVHDAVYSRKDIDTKIIDKEIYAQTGFAITIEKEKI